MATSEGAVLAEAGTRSWNCIRRRRQNELLVAVLLFFASGCGCEPPTHPLPPVGDAKYVEIEQRIERTLHPSVILNALDVNKDPDQVREFVELGYFRRTGRGLFPTATGRKKADEDTWPSSPREDVGEDSYLEYRIGSYAVSKLTSSEYYGHDWCGRYSSAFEQYGFVATLRLNSLGRALLTKHLLYTRANASSPPQLWDGKRPVNDVWENGDPDDAGNYKNVISAGNTVQLKASFYPMTRR
jgi:hypothetical protein